MWLGNVGLYRGVTAQDQSTSKQYKFTNYAMYVVPLLVTSKTQRINRQGGRVRRPLTRCADSIRTSYKTFCGPHPACFTGHIRLLLSALPVAICSTFLCLIFLSSSILVPSRVRLFSTPFHFLTRQKSHGANVRTGWFFTELLGKCILGSDNFVDHDNYKIPCFFFRWQTFQTLLRPESNYRK